MIGLATKSYVLIVDDDEQVREVLRRLLEPAGHEVVEAESAEAAVQRIKSRPPDVAFCDIHMPGANGLWLADQVRTLSPTTALVLATGDPHISPAESLRSGVVAYLIKPLRGDSVRAAVADGMQWSADARARAAKRPGGKRLGPATSDS